MEKLSQFRDRYNASVLADPAAAGQVESTVSALSLLLQASSYDAEVAELRKFGENVCVFVCVCVGGCEFVKMDYSIILCLSPLLPRRTSLLCLHAYTKFLIFVVVHILTTYLSFPSPPPPPPPFFFTSLHLYKPTPPPSLRHTHSFGSL